MKRKYSQHLPTERLLKRAFKQHKQDLKYNDESISLFIESTGDRSVGIDSERIEIKMWSGYIRPDNMLRKEVKELFKDAVEPLFATNVGNMWFEDECIECGCTIEVDNKCANKNCISNMPEEADEFTETTEYCPISNED